MSRRILVLAAAAAVVLLAYQYWRPLPALSAKSLIIAAPKTVSDPMPWPAGAQAALGAEGYGLAAEHSDSAPVPIASIAKVITALAVLRQKPLSLGEQGPFITMDNTDLGYFNYYYLNDGSVALVRPGEKISQYQLMEAMLLPSANNAADSLARWAFGSIPNYVSYANRMVKDMGLEHTTVGSTNGFADKTTSTAGDIVRLGLAAMQNPVIAQIVGQKTADVPVAGAVKNVNYLLGSDGTVGIKTGNTDKAGGCFLFAAVRAAAGRQVTIVGAVLGAKNLAGAIAAAPPLIRAAAGNFERITVIGRGQAAAVYQTPWGASARLKPAHPLFLTVWKGQDIKILNNLEPVTAPRPAGSDIGSIEVRSGLQTASSPLELSADLTAPSWGWRLLRK